MDDLRRTIRHIIFEEFSKGEKDWFAKGEGKPNVDNSKKEIVKKVKKITDKEATVGDVLKQIQDSNKKTWRNSILGGVGEFIYWMVVPIIPIVGQTVLTLSIIWSIFRGRQSELAPKFKSIEKFPLFQKLTMHPDYVKILDDPLLNDIMKKYESYLATVKPETKISNVVSINDFIKQVVENNSAVRISLQEAMNRANLV